MAICSKLNKKVRKKVVLLPDGLTDPKTMINRALIRLKVVQVIYAYYQNGAQKPSSAGLELARSLDSAYSLYKTLLYLPVAISGLARKSVARQKRMNETHISRKEELLAENKFIAQLESNLQLMEYVRDNDFEWLLSSDYIKETCEGILKSDAMEEYWQEEKFDYEADKELCKKIYKEFVENSDALDCLLEEQDIYWNGDKELIDSFVMKTMRSFTENSGPQQPLQSEFKDEEDRQFALDLLDKGLAAADMREKAVNANCRRWDPSRLAFLDVIIIQVALAEIMGFPNIPLKVSINEYVELAKLLSTPASGSFVNGMLDTIIKDMKAGGELTKEL